MTLVRFKRIAQMLTAISVASCTTGRPLLGPESQPLKKQISVVSSLEKGKDIAQVIHQLPYQKQVEFDYGQNGKQHTFLEVKNNETGASFGLYFVNQKLAGVLSNRDAGLLLICRDLRMPNPNHWTEYEIEPMSSWIASKSVLGKGNAAADQDPELRFDADYYRDRQPGNIESGAMVLGYSLVYAPFFVVGAPFLAYGLVNEQLPGEKRRQALQQQAQEENTRKEKKRKDGFPEVQIGIGRERLIQLMGEPEVVERLTSESAEYLWFGYYGVRVDNGRVTLKETPAWKNYLGPLENYRAIIRKNNLQPEQECW